MHGKPKYTCEELTSTQLVHRTSGRLSSIPVKVLWAVISKTIPWMAALIENNEGHIEHMVAVVSPPCFPPPLRLFSPALTLCLSLFPQTKGSVKLCHSQVKICVAKKEKREDTVKVALFSLKS